MRCAAAAAIMLGEIIRPCGVVWCSFKPDAVEAELVHLLPDLEMLLVGARADLGIPMVARQRIGDQLVALVVLEVAVVGQQVEDEDFH